MNTFRLIFSFSLLLFFLVCIFVSCVCVIIITIYRPHLTFKQEELKQLNDTFLLTGSLNNKTNNNNNHNNISKFFVNTLPFQKKNANLIYHP